MPIITLSNTTPYRVAVPGVGVVNGRSQSQVFITQDAYQNGARAALLSAQAHQGITYTVALSPDETALTGGAISTSIDPAQVPYSGDDLEATNIKASIDELAAASGGGGTTQEMLVVEFDDVVQGDYTPAAAVVSTTHKHLLVKAVKVERLSETGSPVVELLQTESFAPSKPVALVNAGTMQTPVEAAVLYGPMQQEMGDKASSVAVCIYAGGVGFTVRLRDSLSVYPPPELPILSSWRVTMLVEPITVPAGW